VRVVVLIVVLAAAAAGGLLWRARTGRIRPATATGAATPLGGADREPSPAAGAATPPADQPATTPATPADEAVSDAAAAAPAPGEHADVWARLGIEPDAAAVTLVQFSSAFCAPCRATRRILGDVADRVPDVRHVEVDAESHLDVVRTLDVRSTPTTLLVDRGGRITGRAVGQPRPHDVLAAIGPYLSAGA